MIPVQFLVQSSEVPVHLKVYLNNFWYSGLCLLIDFKILYSFRSAKSSLLQGLTKGLQDRDKKNLFSQTFLE